jgi:acyl-coenzyme A synthetase/AMP-(fatty) acid ligase
VLLLSSMTHTYGLIGGLLHALRSGAELAVPELVTADGILAAVAASTRPTSLVAVPHHITLLAAASGGAVPVNLAGAMSAGEMMRPRLAESFEQRFGLPLGEIYGMTETGLLASDLTGRNRPATGWPAPGIEVRVDEGELSVRLARNPYLAGAAAGRWADGWLRTRDAASIDPRTGLIRLYGRTDSQVSVGGLKVDLTEVEHELAAVAGVRAAVVVMDRVIVAFAELTPGTEPAAVRDALAARLAPYKLPRTVRAVEALPRTSTGKLVRDLTALRAAPAAGSR